MSSSKLSVALMLATAVLMFLHLHVSAIGVPLKNSSQPAAAAAAAAAAEDSESQPARLMIASTSAGCPIPAAKASQVSSSSYSYDVTGGELYVQGCGPGGSDFELRFTGGQNSRTDSSLSDCTLSPDGTSRTCTACETSGYKLTNVKAVDDKGTTFILQEQASTSYQSTTSFIIERVVVTGSSSYYGPYSFTFTHNEEQSGVSSVTNSYRYRLISAGRALNSIVTAAFSEECTYQIQGGLMCSPSPRSRFVVKCVG